MLLKSLPNIVSFLILCFLFYGRSLRLKNKHKHAMIMALVIGADVLLILFLVFGRQALDKVSPHMPWALKLHIPIAVSTVICYGIAIQTGLKLLKGNKNALPAMRRIDKVVVPLRVLTFVTSVLVQLTS